MKKLTFIFCLLLAPVATLPTGCSTAPSARVVATQTLKSVGQTAESSIAVVAQLYADGKITPVQARTAMDFYNTRFQPAFRLAVAASRANLDTVASPEVFDLCQQLIALVAQLKSP